MAQRRAVETAEMVTGVVLVAEAAGVAVVAWVAWVVAAWMVLAKGAVTAARWVVAEGKAAMEASMEAAVQVAAVMEAAASLEGAVGDLVAKTGEKWAVMAAEQYSGARRPQK